MSLRTKSQNSATYLDDSIRILSIELPDGKYILIPPMQIPLTGHDKVRRSLLTSLEIRHGCVGIHFEYRVESESVEEETEGGAES